MRELLRSDGLIGSRTLLTYLALMAGVAALLPGADYLSSVLVIAAIMLGWGSLRTVARGIFAVILIGTALTFVSGAVTLEKAVGNMAQISSLIIAVMLLSAVLSQSGDIKTISRSLFSGGRSTLRYLGITAGSVALAVPLNFGAVSVISTLIGVQVRDQGDSAASRNAARAVTRGFGASPMASPLSVSVVMTVTALPALTSWKLLALSLPFAALYLMFGALFREKEAVEVSDQIETGRSVRAAWFRFLGIISLVCVGAFVLNSQAGLLYSQAATLSCLAVVVVNLLGRMLRGAKLSLPPLANINNELAIMGGSSFLGGLIGAYALIWIGGDFALPTWAYPLVASAVPWIFFLGGALGINPIISCSLSASILGPIWPEQALLGLGLGIVTGWGITVAGTPFSANTLLVERCAGYSSRVVAYDWSLIYSLLLLTLSSLCCVLLTLLST